MYYRLIAVHLLPREIKRIIYLDTDILVINSLRPLWELDLKGNTFAAASHKEVINVMSEVERIRIDAKHSNFNTGVLLIDLEKARLLVKPKAVINCMNKHQQGQLNPNQDVFSDLYAEQTLLLNDMYFNYDARCYTDYMLLSKGLCSMRWIMQNTIILHFCGKKKPWMDHYSKQFDALYKHYMRFADWIGG